jgi:hypothetical protein
MVQGRKYESVNVEKVDRKNIKKRLMFRGYILVYVGSSSSTCYQDDQPQNLNDLIDRRNGLVSER